MATWCSSAGKCLNKYTGEILWTDSSAVHWERYDWGGRTLMLHSSNGQLVDPLTGTDVVYFGPQTRNGEGWYRDRCVHGTNMLWTLDEVWEVAGSKVNDLGDPGTVYYTQPLTVGNYGWFVQGGHGKGGTLKCVDLNNGTTWTVGGSTQLAVRDRVLSAGGGRVYVSYATPSGPVVKLHVFDGSGAASLAELGYSSQRIYIQAGKGLTCLSVGALAPILEETGDVVWSPASASAEAKAELLNTGGSGVNAFVSWGLTDGGSDPGDWEHTTAVGPCSVGGISGHAERIEQQQGLLVPVLGHERYRHGLVQTGRATRFDVCRIHGRRPWTETWCCTGRWMRPTG